MFDENRAIILEIGNSINISMLICIYNDGKTLRQLFDWYYIDEEHVNNSPWVPKT